MSDAGTAATATTATSDATGAAAATATAPWYGPRNDAEFTGTLQNRGLDKKDAAESAFEFYKAHREATQMISKLTGTPDKDRILVVPKPDAPQAEKDAFYAKLGRPDKAEAYDFKDVKFPDGTELDDAFVGFLRNAAFKTNMGASEAQAFARDMVGYLNTLEQAESADAGGKLATEQATLKKDWGANFDANKFIAAQAVAKLGITREAAEAMEKSAGYAAVMQAFLKVGMALGEDKFVASRAPGSNVPMTQSQAKARWAELKQDVGYMDRLNKGDSLAKQEFDAIAAMIAGGG